MEPAAVVREYFAAWLAGDGARLETALDPEVDASGPIRSVHGGAAHAASLVSSSRGLHDIVVERVHADGPEVLTWFTLHTTAGVAMPAANWCTVADGRITRVRVTFDPRPLLPPT